MTGWGSGGYGLTPWGGLGGGARLSLVECFALRENVFRMTFSAQPAYTGVLDQNDAGNVDRYSVVPVAGTVGSDGRPARAVGPIQPLLVPGLPTAIDLVVDRPMSPYPAQYLVAADGLVDVLGNLLLAGSSLQALGVYQTPPPPSFDKAVTSPDFSHPDSMAALLDPVPFQGNPKLGGIPAGGDGDYAVDDGNVNLRKRVIRRLLTVKSGFAHLPGYGVGVGTFLKRLASVGGRQAIAADAEKQVSQEPDVVRCRVRVELDDAAPELGRFIVLVRTAHNGDAKFTVPFSAV